MRTIIIDDEKQIVLGLKILLQKTSLTLIGEAYNFKDGVDLINATKPDLLFLDIQIHQRTGFEILAAAERLDFKLIFITAYNEYAIKAFKYNAFDFLLKPIDPEELEETLLRLEQTQPLNHPHLQALTENKDLTHLIVRTTEYVHKLALKDIIYCKADQGYTHFHLNNGTSILSSKTLKEYDNLLPAPDFVRVHQSYLVRWSYVTGYDKKGVLNLRKDMTIPVSVRKRKQILALLS